MGVSFKVAKAGTRYRPRPAQVDEREDSSKEQPTTHGDAYESLRPKPKDDSREGDDFAEFSNSLAKSELNPVSQDLEVSFSLNLLPDGFSVGRPTQGGILPLFQDVAKQLHPYDRASETLFSAIEHGQLPGDILDDLPCKYVNGAILCEVRDYRKCIPRQRDSAREKHPVIHKVRLQMCMENVVQDILSISNDTWTYKDLLEVESHILKALQPQLCLEPTPSLDRLYETQAPKRLNLGLMDGRTRRKPNCLQAAYLVPNNICNGSNIISTEFENLNSNPNLAVQDLKGCSQQIIPSGFPNEQQKGIFRETLEQAIPIASGGNYQVAVNFSRPFSRAMMVPSNSVCIPEQHLSGSCSNQKDPGRLLLTKRVRGEGQLVQQSNLKRSKQEHLNLVQQQFSGNHMGIILGSNNEIGKIGPTRLSSQKQCQRSTSGSTQTIQEGIPKLQAKMPSYIDQREVQYSVNEEPAETSKFYKTELGKIIDEQHVTDGGKDQSNHQKTQMHQLSNFMRANIPTSMQQNHMGQHIDKDPSREDVTQKKRSLQSPQVSAEGVVHSPGPSRSGEFSSISMGVPCSTSATNANVGLHKDKATSISSTCVGPASLNFGHSDFLLRDDQSLLLTKRKSNSLPKTQNMGGIGSPASVGATNAFNANSPSVGTFHAALPSGTLGDPVLERFLKIDMLVQRYHLNHKKKKFDQFLERRLPFHISQVLVEELSKFGVTTNLIDTGAGKISMSNCFQGCSKTRIMRFVHPGQTYQGNGISVVLHESWNKLQMSEKSEDRIVEACVTYGDEEDSNSISFPQYYGFTLPNNHSADLFAFQFSSLMRREGYQLMDDKIEPNSINTSSSQQSIVVTSATPVDGTDERPSLAPISCQSPCLIIPMSSDMPTLNTLQMTPQNILAGGSLLPAGNSSATLQHSAGYLSKLQQLDTTAYMTTMSQQQQQPWIRRSSPLIGRNSNPSRNTNLPMADQMINSPANLQLHLRLRQRQQYQQQSIMQKKMMGGLGATTGMVNPGMIRLGGFTPGIGNLAGLGSMTNVMGMAGAISAPFGANVPMLGNNSRGNRASSFSNKNQQLLFSGISHPPVSVLTKLAQGQERTILSGMSIQGNSFDGVDEMIRASMMNGGSIHATSKSAMSHLQHAGMVQMHTPRFISTTFNMNNQESRQQMQQQVQPLLWQQEQLQEMGSVPQPRQTTILVAEQVGSPLTHASPQQISQQTQMSPQQLSSGPTPRQVRIENIVVGPGSPQLSSQTHGSVGSITSSPMELQGATTIHNGAPNTGAMGGE
ncbi:PREDICTED: uncharacterized protein LOC104591989 [Nelumbo nucifera]|uniref:Protein PHYTOCHROME-DEPENDENT LATE-FLOWERING-like n=2 Tax=Nelumbo nucifera TaxID=4432 RepID=A0A822YWE9_NELNU|nr:PREDICTED: uncharacterized protein LOC104591989 [Nelumbo nucifera]DAD35465.1 TPA_asm: hypothetical protein HUJ06_006105 [Nelumbo nucifera]